MGFKSIALVASTLVLSTSVNAAIISADWQTAGDNLVTRDTDSGLEWLELTESTNMSYNEVSAELAAGGLFEGWRFASLNEVSTYFDNAGGPGDYAGQLSLIENMFAAYLLSFWGITQPTSISDSSSFITGDASTVSGAHYTGQLEDVFESPVPDFAVAIPGLDILDDQKGDYLGSALVRASAVPVPAAVWLFGSGLIGLIGMARRKA